MAEAFPLISRRAGKNACVAADKFFSGRLSNPPTRSAYAQPVGRFLAWCEEQGIELRQVAPGLADPFPSNYLASVQLRHTLTGTTLPHRDLVAILGERGLSISHTHDLALGHSLC